MTVISKFSQKGGLFNRLESITFHPAQRGILELFFLGINTMVCAEVQHIT